jgi:hypothetical protein
MNNGQGNIGYGIQDMNAENSFTARTPSNFHSFKISLCGKKKKVKRGKWKGYEGIIKNVSGTTAKFELSALCKTITIPLKNLNIPKADLEMANGAAGGNRERGQTGTTVQTGFKNGMMTPAYEPMNQFDEWGDN